MTNISHDDKEPAKKPASDDLIFFRDKSATINGPLDGIEVTTASGLVSQGLTENEEGVKTAFDNQVPQITSQEILDGDGTSIRQFSPSDVSAMALRFGPGGAGSTVLSVAGRTGDVLLSGSDITETTDKNFMTDANQAKLGNLNVSSVAGRTGDVLLSATDITENGGLQFITDAEVTKLDNLNVSSVAGRDGAVVLSATDITENGGLQFITDAEVVKLGNLSVSAWSDLVNANLLPDGDLTRNLGSDAAQWSALFVSAINGRDVSADAAKLDTIQAGATADHSSLNGLTDDDHTQYTYLSTGTGNPVGSVTPQRVGHIYVATDLSNAWIATDTGISNWEQIDAAGGGGGGGDSWSDPVSSNILPSIVNDVAFTLGDPDQRFKEIWVSGIHTFSSIDLRGQVFENVGPTSSTLSGVSIAERNAGEETDFRLFSPADISSMALQHGPAAGSITEGALHDLISGLDLSSIQSTDEFLFRVASGTDELAVTTASGIVNRGLTDLGIEQQERVVTTSDPTANDDGVGTAGGIAHKISDLWINTDTNKAYICTDNSTNAAIWQEFAPSGVTTQEITDLSATDYRLWTPEDVSSAIFQHAGGGGGAVTSVAGRTGAVVLSATDITENGGLQFITDAEVTKLGNLNVSSVAGRDGAVVLSATDITENGGLQFITDAEVTKLTNLNVSSVAGRTGDVTLDADDVSETAGKKWLTAAEQTQLGNLNVSSSSDVDHNATTNYVANEHIDWTTNQGATNIDIANINQTQIDHGTIGGLTDDDHTQYLLTTGARTLTGDQDFGGFYASGYGTNTTLLSGVSTTEIAAGISTEYRVWSPADVKSAAFQHGGGGGSLTESGLHDLISGLDASSIQSTDEFLFRVASGTDELAVTTASGIVTKGLDDLGIDPQSREVVAAAPTNDDDIDLGYSSLDLWLDTAAGKFYINQVATDGAAIWREFAPSGVTAQEIADLSATDYRLWTPEDVSSAIFQHAGGGGGGGNAWDDPVSSNIVPNADVTYNIGSADNAFLSVWASALNLSGDITTLGLVDGRDVSVDGAKLDNMSVSSSSDVDHNATTNYVANEHIDWTTNQGATNIDIANINQTQIDHGTIGGLTDDDHTQYLLTTGARTLTGDQDFGNNVADNYATNTTPLSGVSTAEIAAGTSTEYRVWSPADVSSAAFQHGRFTAADETKLDGIEPGAEVNETKAELETKLAEFSISGNSELYSEDAGSAAAPEFSLRRNSASPADGDYLGQIRFDGKNDTGGNKLYAKITGKTSDVTNGTEDGLIETAVIKAGSQTIVARQTGDALKLINGTGLEVDGNITMTTGGATVDGRDVSVDGAKLDNMSVSSSSDVDHNATTNYVANEHIDWTTNQGATNIDIANIDQTQIDHGTIGGLTDDDHTQYLLTTGARTLTGDQDFGGFYASGYGTNTTLLSGVSTTEIAAGTGTEYRVWSPADVSSAAFQHGRFTAADESKLDGIEPGAEVNTVSSVNTQTGAVVLDADDISDAATTNKFATAAELAKLANLNVSSVAGKTGDVTLDADDVAETAAKLWLTAAERSQLGNLNVSSSSDVDHNATTNYVANEHIDWTTDQGATNINNANIDSSLIDHDNLTNFVANEHIDWTTDQGATNIDPGNYQLRNYYCSVNNPNAETINTSGMGTGVSALLGPRGSEHGSQTKMDLQGFSQVKLSLVRGGGGTITNLKLGLAYKTGGFDTSIPGNINNFISLGDSTEVEVACPNQLTPYGTSWIDLASGAKTDDTIIATYVTGVATDPDSIGWIKVSAEFR